MSNQRVSLPESELKPRAGERWLPGPPPSNILSVTILLRKHSSTMAPEQDPLSGNWHALGREEASAALSAAPADMDAVRAFAQQNGLEISEENADARCIRVEGTAEQIAQAFGVQFQWAEASDGQRYMIYSGSISLPQSLEGVVTGVLGLDQRPIAKHHAQ